jgi:hypothetical protein
VQRETWLPQHDWNDDRGGRAEPALGEAEHSVIEHNLAWLCGITLVAVFVLLAILAAAMELIARLFPQRPARVDAALAAAIQATVSASVPGARVTRIEEDP